MAFPSIRSPRSVLSRNFSKLSVLLLASGVLLITGCQRAAVVAPLDPHDPNFVVAEKGDWKVTRAQLDAEIANYLKQKQIAPAQVGANLPKLETAMADSLVLKQLLLAKAATLPLKDVDKDEATAMDTLKQHIPPGKDLDTELKNAGMTQDKLKQSIHEEVVINKVLEAEAFKNVEPTEQEINDFYMAHKDAPPITTPAQMRASRILIKVDNKTTPAEKAAKKKAIDQARARVAKGEDFSKVASQVSEDADSAPKGGDIGLFQKGMNEENFDENVFNLKLNELSPVFLTPLGYQFVKVTDIQPAGVKPVAEFRGQIADYLRRGKQAVQEQDYTKKLLTDSGVTFHIKLVDLSAPPVPPAGGPGGAPPEADPNGPAPDAQAAPAPAPAAAPASTTPATK
jgi:parvulin-like peptidyl-prolyl isomerase